MYTLTFNGDGAYKVIPHIKDTAENANEGVAYADSESKANELFVLDSTAPQISVSYDKDSETNPKSEYVKDSEATSDKDSKRVMTIIYTERNFTENGLTFNVSINGEKKEDVSLEKLKEIDAEHIKVSEPEDSQKDVKELKNYTNDRTNKYTITFIGDGAYEVIPHIKRCCWK